MTPEDLTAIGIKKPHHRKRLKTEIGRLNIGDGLPSYLPASLEEWLRLLRLEEYGPQLRAQGYHTIQVKLPASLQELLRLLRLEEYGPQLRAQGYHTIQVTDSHPRGVAPAASDVGVRASAQSTGIPHYPGNCQPP